MSFLKNSVMTLFTRIFVFLLMLTASVYIARVLGPEAKGIYALLTQLVFLSVLFMDLGIQNASVFFLGKKEPLDRIYPNVISISLITGLIVFVCLLSSLSFLKSTFLRNIDSGLILVAIFCIPFKIFTELSSSVILGINKIRAMNTLRITHFSLFLIIFSILVIALKLQLKGAILSFTITELIMVFVYLLAISKWSRICLRFDFKLIKKLLRYGICGFLVPLLLLLIFRIDFFLLNFFQGVKSVGFYSVAVSFAELLWLVPEVIGMILFAKLASGRPELIKQNTMQTLRILFSMLVMFSLLLFSFASRVIIFVYGEQYLSSIVLMRILIPGFLMMALYYIFFSYFFSKGRPEIVTLVIFLTMIIKIILATILIPAWGIRGAAVCSTITYLLCASAFITVFLKYTKASLLEILLVKFSDLQLLYNQLRICHPLKKQR